MYVQCVIRLVSKKGEHMKKIRVWAIKRHVWVMKKKKRSVGIQEWIEKMNDCGPRTHEDQAKKTKKKEQLFVRPMMMMTLVVPIFFPPPSLSAFRYNLARARGERKTRRQTRRTKKKHTKKRESFREKPAFLRRRARAGGRAGGRVDAETTRAQKHLAIERERHTR